ncbi:MAG: hypothetical protein H0U74_11205 [Bradymonadaceae bacterium]|nr:hypothetical protein [Lujinxingiaceae bacterium]
MKRTLYVAWQAIESRKWYTIGVLTHEPDKGYLFRYLRGVEEAQKDGFTGISAFPEFYLSYTSDRLFSFFANRVLSSDRPSYKELIEQVGLQPVGDSTSPEYLFEFLRRTRGWRATDSFEMFSPVEKVGDEYRWDFFTRALRHAPEGIQRRWIEESPTLPMRMAPDLHNMSDPTAVFVMDCKHCFMGFVPGNYSSTIHELVTRAVPGSIDLRVLRHNKREELHQKRFLLEMRVKMPADFQLTQPRELEPLVNMDESVA